MDRLQYDSKIVELFIRAVPISEIVKTTGASKEYINRLATLTMRDEREVNYAKKQRKRRTKKRRNTPNKKQRDMTIAEMKAAKQWNEKLLNAINIDAPYVVKMMRYKRGCISAEGMDRFPTWKKLIEMWKACGGAASSDFVNDDDYRERVAHGHVIISNGKERGDFTIERKTDVVPDMFDLIY